MWHVREDVLANLITAVINLLESSYVELNLRNDKRFINCSYNPHLSLIVNHLDAVGKTSDLRPSTFDKIIVLGDFNTEIDEQHMKSFSDSTLSKA